MLVHHATLKKYERNLMGLYQNAEVSDHVAGITWYKEANEYANKLSNMFNVSLDKVCQVMAILSPAASWEKNKLSAFYMLKAYSENSAYDSFKVTTYGANKKKAWEVLTLNKTIPSTGLKVYSFYRNILNPNIADTVTIDRHAIKAMKGIDKAGKQAVTSLTYRKASFVYTRMASRLGIKPHEFQAIVWLAYKRRVGR